MQILTFKCNLVSISSNFYGDLGSLFRLDGTLCFIDETNIKNEYHNQSDHLQTKPHQMVIATLISAFSFTVEVSIDMLKKGGRYLKMVYGEENVNIDFEDTVTWVSTLKDDNVDMLHHLMAKSLCKKRQESQSHIRHTEHCCYCVGPTKILV